VNPGALAAWLAAAPSLAPLAADLERAAASEAPILLLGEAGTGRTTLARALAAASSRAEGPLVEVDPGALPATLFESELFGHRAGAFTGADRGSPGRVERARGGTLLIDHVEELPLAAQPKLLRLLSERRFAPLGGAEVEADVRFLAVGADDLVARIGRGAFREDLFYRIEVLTFRLPPLRARRGDVPALAGALLADLAERFARPGLTLSERALAWLPEQPWPGNGRQLRNLLERELLSRDGPLLDPEPPREAEGPRPQSLEEAERQAILAALAHTRGHQARAARLLGISRKGLWEKRRRLGIP
jgi:DNA-binding NtrC family response regulator